VDLRRELNNIRKHYRNFQDNYGESVVWFEFNPLGNNTTTNSVYDDVYDEDDFGGNLSLHFHNELI
jgi:hypothetical protein